MGRRSKAKRPKVINLNSCMLWEADHAKLFPYGDDRLAENILATGEDRARRLALPVYESNGWVNAERWPMVTGGWWDKLRKSQRAILTGRMKEIWANMVIDYSIVADLGVRFQPLCEDHHGPEMKQYWQGARSGAVWENNYQGFSSYEKNKAGKEGDKWQIPSGWVKAQYEANPVCPVCQRLMVPPLPLSPRARDMLETDEEADAYWIDAAAKDRYMVVERLLPGDQVYGTVGCGLMCTRCNVAKRNFLPYVFGVLSNHLDVPVVEHNWWRWPKRGECSDNRVRAAMAAKITKKAGTIRTHAEKYEYEPITKDEIIALLPPRLRCPRLPFLYCQPPGVGGQIPRELELHLDRINEEEDADRYERGLVMWCSGMANQMMSSLTHAEIRRMAEYLKTSFLERGFPIEVPSLAAPYLPESWKDDVTVLKPRERAIGDVVPGLFEHPAWRYVPESEYFD